MREFEESAGSAAAAKEKIRARYKGVNPDDLEVIPALPKDNIFEESKLRRVAVYARVSTGDPRQTSSYELQKNHYLDVVNRNPSWELVDIYADEGISGTSLMHREQFKRMIADCKRNRIDLIVTKSVSRFARNVMDCIGYVRELKALNPPIGVLFETEGIFTLDGRSDMQLAFMATTAQEESHNKSEIMNASIEMRFRRGIFLTPKLLGYDLDSEGMLVINEEEAKTVRLIFFMYLYGYTCQNIADQLTLLERKTKKGNTVWTPGAVLQQLQNERHCGDVLARKTWTPDYLNHRSVKNRQDRNQYRKLDHHEAIISRDDFITVQHMISNAKYGSKGILPELHVISEGALFGFVTIHPKWRFKKSDYLNACQSAYGEGEIILNPPINEIVADAGDFDLRDFEVARTQFFNNQRMMSITFSYSDLKFSINCIHKIPEHEFVELLINPKEHLLAVRPAKKDSKTAVQWRKTKDGNILAKNISGAAFIPILYDMFGWDRDCRYRIRGTRHQKDTEQMLIFDMYETEVFIPSEVEQFDDDGEIVKVPQPILDDDADPLTATSTRVCGFPGDWASGFGTDFYTHAQAQELRYFAENGEWLVQAEGDTFVTRNPDPVNRTSSADLEVGIEKMINDMQIEGVNTDE